MPRMSFRAKGRLLQIDVPDGDDGWTRQQGHFLLAKTGSSWDDLKEVFVKRFRQAVPEGHMLLLSTMDHVIPNTAQLLRHHTEYGFHYYIFILLQDFKDLDYYLQSGGDYAKFITPASAGALLAQLCEALQEINRRGFYHPDVCFKNIMVRFQHMMTPDFALIDLDSCWPVETSTLPSSSTCDSTWWSLFLYRRFQNVAYLNPTMILSMGVVFLQSLVEIRRGAKRERIREVLLGRPDDQRAYFEAWDRGDPLVIAETLRPLNPGTDKIVELVQSWRAILADMEAKKPVPWDAVRSFGSKLLSLAWDADDIWLGRLFPLTDMEAFRRRQSLTTTDRPSYRYRTEQERSSAFAQVWDVEGQQDEWRENQYGRLRNVGRQLNDIGIETPWLFSENDVLVDLAQLPTGGVKLTNREVEDALATLERWKGGIPLNVSFGSSFSGRVRFSSDGTLLAIGGHTVWDVGNGCILDTLNTPWNSAMAFSPDSRLLALVYEDRELSEDRTVVTTWSLLGKYQARRTVLEKFRPSDWSKYFDASWALSVGGDILAETNSGEGDVTLWNLVTGRMMRRLKLSFFRTLSGGFSGHSLAFSPDGTRLAAGGGQPKNVVMWDIEHLKTVFIFETKGKERVWEKVTAVAFSPNGRMVASLTDHGNVSLLDAGTGAEIWSRRYDQSYSDLAFCPNGGELVLGGSVLRVINADSGKELWSVPGNCAAVGALASEQIVTAGLSSHNIADRYTVSLHLLSGAHDILEKFKTAAGAWARQVASRQQDLATKLRIAKVRLADVEDQRDREMVRSKSETDERRMAWHAVETSVGVGERAFRSLDELIPHADSDVTVRLESGTYVVERPLSLMNKNLMLMGSGGGQTVILVRGPSHGFYVGEGANCHFKDLTMLYTGQEGDIIWCGAGNLVMEGCMVKGAIKGSESGGYGLRVYGTGNANLSDCALVSNMEAGVRASGEAQVVIQRCCLASNNDGVWLSGHSSGSLIDNVVIDNVNGGIMITSDGETETQNNVCLRNGTHGIAIGGSARSAVAYNICEDNGGVGIIFWKDANGRAQQNLCLGNDYGIAVRDQARPLLEGNICIENRHEGITYRESSSGIARRNICLENGSYGIGAGGESQPDFEYNVCQANGNAGVVFWGTAKGKGARNYCVRNKGSGIVVRDHAEPILEINECNQNEGSGILVTNSAKPLLESNECDQNRHNGITFIDTAGGVAKGNHGKRNRQGGISTTGRARPILEGDAWA